MKTTSEITLHDLMGEDLTVWIKKNDKFGFNLEIENYEGETLVKELGLHPYAMESFADICRSFVRFYDNIVCKSDF